MTPKQLLVEKIAKEQKLDPKKLHRLNFEELTKMDAVVPDSDLLGSDSPELPTTSGSDQDGLQTVGDGDVDSSEHSGGSPNDTQLGSSSQEGTAPVVTPPESPSEEPEVETGTDVQTPPAPSVDSGTGSRFVIGFHPVSEKPIYSDEQ